MFKDLKYPLIWLNIYLFAITSLLETIWYSMITKLMIKRFHYSLIESNELTFYQTMGGILLIPISAVYSQRHGKKNIMYILGFISMILSCFLLIMLPDGKSPLVYISLFLYAFF
jgi:MFS family permease